MKRTSLSTFGKDVECGNGRFVVDLPNTSPIFPSHSFSKLLGNVFDHFRNLASQKGYRFSGLLSSLLSYCLLYSLAASFVHGKYGVGAQKVEPPFSSPYLFLFSGNGPAIGNLDSLLFNRFLIYWVKPSVFLLSILAVFFNVCVVVFFAPLIVFLFVLDFVIRTTLPASVSESINVLFTYPERIKRKVQLAGAALFEHPFIMNNTLREAI